MADFFLDLRPERLAAAEAAGNELRFSPETRVQILHRPAFSLAITRAETQPLWDPASLETDQGEILVALAGRVAFDANVWSQGQSLAGTGGAASRIIAHEYQRKGSLALEQLNGNFCLLLYDEARRKILLVTDPAGMTMAYSNREGTFCSHPDVLAELSGEEMNWDSTSLAQFAMTGCLTFPYTFYRKIKALDTGSLYEIDLASETQPKSRRYFDFEYAGDGCSRAALAEELASAFSNAVKRRTLPIFGVTGVALSGGLDSRTILSAAADPGAVKVFSLCNEDNSEVRVARDIASALHLKLNVIQRDFDFYGRSMGDGARILGGAASLASNHFLSARREIAQLGITNLLTGCYCDYLLKALALNTCETKFLRRQKQTPFQFSFYRPFFTISTDGHAQVTERLQERFPEHAKQHLDDRDWFNIERNRSFPLAYEADAAQRLIPQRVLPWYPPMADRDLLKVYRKIPSHLKLDARLFTGMMQHICPPQLLRITDNNTGAPVNASILSAVSRRYVTALQNRAAAWISPSITTRGSWPNWSYYIAHSELFQNLWSGPCPAFADFLANYFPAHEFNLPQIQSSQTELILRLVTIKLWMEQRSDSLPAAALGAVGNFQMAGA